MVRLTLIDSENVERIRVECANYTLACAGLIANWIELFGQESDAHFGDVLQILSELAYDEETSSKWEDFSTPENNFTIRREPVVTIACE